VLIHGEWDRQARLNAFCHADAVARIAKLFGEHNKLIATRSS
jgi:hypothetical protein